MFIQPCAKFGVSSMIRSVSRTFCHHQWLGGLWGFLTGVLEDMSHPWHFKHSSYMIPNMSAKFQLCNMIWSVSRTPPPIIINELEDIQGSWLETWRTWVIIYFIFFLGIGFLTCVQNFRILAWSEVCQEPPCHQWLGGHWWFLTRDLEDVDHPWPHNCYWCRIPDVCKILAF